jgi:hypothetical protein
MYAKIDENGNVIEFPLSPFLPKIDINSSDIVEVDTEANKPHSTWNTNLYYDGIENIDGRYVLKYKTSERYSDFDSKKKAIEELVNLYSGQNEGTFESLSKDFNSSYTQSEINTWNLQIVEANNYLNGIGEYSFISKLAEERNVSVNYLANKIVEKHNSYISNYSIILGKYQKNRELLSNIDLNNELTFHLIDQYGW